MAMSYTTLTGDKTVAGSIKSWVNYTRLDVDTILEEAQTTIYQTLRVREMKATQTLSVTSGVDFIAHPADLMAPVKLRNVTDDTELKALIWDELEERRTWTNGTLDTGDPCFFSISDEAFQFDCKTSSAFTLRLAYYKTPELLSGTNETNFLTIRYPQLLRAACLAHAAMQYHDDSAYGLHMQRLSALVLGVNTQDDFDDHYGQFTRD
ncbi:hypothetical protein ASD54_12285 [Rhizobium sp. Root149]|uniref:phage adaptor protein n=1 Tax=Rhizobium sp. Root149 TaxID=1736473 RepID=UPI0007133FD4|nr:hypothetical protein [Rhizobium sp. Root149]KQZ49710.1 hypothetical protein ASD54_12285 [Rhizobium sp. Root149]